MKNETLYRDDIITESIEKHSDTLIRVSFAYMKNMSEAEDITQDAFIKLIEKQPSFESIEHEKAWLIRVTINMCKNRLKTVWFRKTIPFDDFSFKFTPKESMVMDAVMELPSKYRSIIHLYYYEGYSIGEISGILSHKEATIGSWLHRARKLLKSILKEDFDNE